MEYNGDESVAHMISRIEGGYVWSKSDWVGGDASLPRLCACKKNAAVHCNCGGNEGSDDMKSTSVGTPMVCTSSESIEIAKLRLEVARLKQNDSAKYGRLKAEVVSEMQCLLRLPPYVHALNYHSMSPVDINVSLPVHTITVPINAPQSGTVPVHLSSPPSAVSDKNGESFSKDSCKINEGVESVVTSGNSHVPMSASTLVHLTKDAHQHAHDNHSSSSNVSFNVHYCILF